MEIAIARFLVWLKLLVAVRPILVKVLPFLSVTANYFDHLCSDNTLDLEPFFSPLSSNIHICNFFYPGNIPVRERGGVVCYLYLPEGETRR